MELLLHWVHSLWAVTPRLLFYCCDDSCTVSKMLVLCEPTQLCVYKDIKISLKSGRSEGLGTIVTVSALLWAITFKILADWDHTSVQPTPPCDDKISTLIQFWSSVIQKICIFIRLNFKKLIIIRQFFFVISLWFKKQTFEHLRNFCNSLCWQKLKF